MIRVNLCPPEELENPYWWVPDAAMLATLTIVGVLGIQYYVLTIQHQIEETMASRDSLTAGFNQLAPEIDRYKRLQTDKAVLISRLNSLRSITVSKIAKFKPVIVLEHLQNLKPDGVWFRRLDMTTDNHFSLTGQAFDNVLVAELMTALKATEAQDVSQSDLRTQVHFHNIQLQKSTVTDTSGSTGFSDLSQYPIFEMSGEFVEAPSVAAAPASAPAVGPTSEPGAPTKPAAGTNTTRLEPQLRPQIERAVR